MSNFLIFGWHKSPTQVKIFSRTAEISIFSFCRLCPIQGAQLWTRLGFWIECNKVVTVDAYRTLYLATQVLREMFVELVKHLHLIALTQVLSMHRFVTPNKDKPHNERINFFWACQFGKDQNLNINITAVLKHLSCQFFLHKTFEIRKKKAKIQQRGMVRNLAWKHSFYR